jgi:hypothetical protein
MMPFEAWGIVRRGRNRRLPTAEAPRSTPSDRKEGILVEEKGQK